MDRQYTPGDVFGRAARIGPVAGAYFTILFLSVAYAGWYPLLSVPALVMIPAVPWLLYRRLRQSAATMHGARTASLWTEGIYTFLFGGLIMALLVYLWLKYIDPDYLDTQLRLALSLIKANPHAVSEEMRATIEAASDHGAMPGPIQMAMSLFWTVTFTGAVLSLLVAFIIAKTKSSK